MRPTRLRPLSLALALSAFAGGLAVAPHALAEGDPAPEHRWFDDQPDTIAPRLEVLAPLDWGDQEHAKVQIEVRVHDVDDPAAQVTVRAALDEDPFTQIVYDADTGTHRGYVDLEGRAQGDHQLRIVGEDPEGHTTTLAGSVSGVLRPSAALLGAWSGQPTVTGDVPVQVLASDPQTPAKHLRVRVGAAQPGVFPYALGTESQSLTWDPLSGTFRGTWDSTTVPNDSTWTERGVTYQAWPMVVEVRDPDGLTDVEGVLVHPVNAPPPTADVVGFEPAGPVRLVDTRPESPVGATGGAASAGKVVRVTVPEDAADAAAVALSVTATASPADGYVTVWPCGETRPLASSVNVSAGQTAANLVLVQPGSNHQVCAYTSAAMHLIVDLTGFVPGGAGFTPMVPTRLVDTRNQSATAPGRDSVTVVPVIGDPGGHVGTAQVVLNVTATGSRGAGWVTVTSCDDPAATQRFLTTSNLNLDRAGQTVANLVVSEVGPSKGVCVYSSAGTHVIVDQLGWWSASTLNTSHGPVRLFDSRTAGGSVAAGGVRRVVVTGNAMIPAGSNVGGVVANVTLTGAQRGGYVTVWPCDQAQPWTSNLNADRAGQTVAVSTAVGVDDGGGLCLYTSGGGHLIVDLSGWFPEAAAAAPMHATALAAAVPVAAAPQATNPPPPKWGLGHVTVPPNDPSDDVFWYRPPGMTHTGVSRTWDGALHSVIVFEDHDLTEIYGASPDGSLFDIAYQLVRTDGLELGYLSHSRFSDDNSHTCDLAYQRSGQSYDDPLRLDVTDIDGHTVPIADLPQQEQGAYVQLVSCSVVHDRAVILMYVPSGVTRDVVVIRLSDGARLAPPLACTTNPGQVTNDGRFLVSQNADRSYNVCNLDTGLYVTTLPGGWGGVSLNGDGSQAFVWALDRNCNGYELVRIISVATQATLWSALEDGYRLPCRLEWSVETTHYAGPESVFSQYAIDDYSFQSGPVWVVGADGRPRQVGAPKEAMDGSFRPDRFWY